MPCWVELPEGTEVSMQTLTGGSSCERVPFRAAGLEGRVDVTFWSMGRSYADDAIFFDIAAAVALAFVERFKEAS
jgi:hypothetical protein